MIKYYCEDCDDDFEAHPNAEDCPYCGGINIKPKFGRINHFGADSE